MLLIDALSAVRSDMDDNGVLLTHFGNNTAALGASVIPVNDLSKVNPGDYILLGEPGALEGHRLIATSGTSGSGTATMSTPTVNALGAYTPIGAPMFMDSEYQDAIKKAIPHYSTYRPLTRRLVGLAITAGQDTYTLPADFITPDRDSFDDAIGMTSALGGAGGYYSLIYGLANRFSSTGYGSSSNFGSSAWYGLAPIIGNPLDNPNGGMPQLVPTTYTFIRSATPQLIIEPAPTTSTTLTFFYRALHVVPTANTPCTIAQEDERLVYLYAKYLRCMAIATGRSAALKYEINGEKIDHSKAPEYYAAQAAVALTEFEKLTRFIPIGVTG